MLSNVSNVKLRFLYIINPKKCKLEFMTNDTCFNRIKVDNKRNKQYWFKAIDLIENDKIRMWIKMIKCVMSDRKLRVK